MYEWGGERGKEEEVTGDGSRETQPDVASFDCSEPTELGGYVGWFGYFIAMQPSVLLKLLSKPWTRKVP